jgi:hypothetical protein
MRRTVPALRRTANPNVRFGWGVGFFYSGFLTLRVTQPHTQKVTASNGQ